jgi:cob(I)alamin adenosyltransferase
MRLDRIYTRTGDGGKTSLVTGERVAKYDLHIECVGTLDELNSILGIMRTLAGEGPADVTVETERVVQRIQNDLFDAGCLVAAGRAAAGLAPFPEARTAALEDRIDAYGKELDELTTFVLPGGCALNAYAHLARTVCRRTERLLWKLHETAPQPEAVLVYINRLSDYLFVYARWVAKRCGAPEYPWQKPG